MKPNVQKFAATLGEFDWSNVDRATEARVRKQWGEADEEHASAALLDDTELTTYWEEVWQITDLIVRQIDLAKKEAEKERK